MSYTRRVRLEYYEVCCRPKDDNAAEPDQDFDLRLWISKVNGIPLEERAQEYYQEKSRVERIRHDKDSGMWVMSFVRLRETNIPAKGKVNKESQAMDLDDDEFVSEDAAAIYDPKLGVLLLQRNRFSLGPSGIEEYLNLMWTDENTVIYLRPIAPRNLVAKAKKAPYYRRMTIRFADIDEAKGEFKALGPFLKSFGKYGAITAEIKITMGRTRNTTLEPETVRDSIADIVENAKHVTKAEFGVKMDDDATVETVDLFADKIHRFISVTLERRQSMISEFLFDQMIEVHTGKKAEVIAALEGDGDDSKGEAG